MILVAGPYRSGTGDDPARLAAARAEGKLIYTSIATVPAP
jgi:hypothetical protein